MLYKIWMLKVVVYVIHNLNVKGIDLCYKSIKCLRKLKQQKTGTRFSYFSVLVNIPSAYLPQPPNCLIPCVQLMQVLLAAICINTITLWREPEFVMGSSWGVFTSKFFTSTGILIDIDKVYIDIDVVYIDIDMVYIDFHMVYINVDMFYIDIAMYYYISTVLKGGTIDAHRFWFELCRCGSYHLDIDINYIDNIDFNLNCVDLVYINKWPSDSHWNCKLVRFISDFLLIDINGLT